jgi:hypothetical protein
MVMEKSQNETDNLSADEKKLREICRSLKKIDAPKDFDFKLKARLANAKPADFQPRFGSAFRYALPALAVILVLGLVAYIGGFRSSDNKSLIVESPLVPQNSTTLPQNSAVSSFTPPETSRQPDNTAAVPKPDSPDISEKSRPQVAGASTRTRKRDLPKAGKDNFIGSRDSALTQPKVPDFNVLKNPGNLQTVPSSNPITVKEILSTNGISADFENGKWKVKSVTANSLGESSGVRENDIIEAIDSQPLSAETVFDKTVKGKTITVMRNGEKTQITLRNKQ